MDGREVGGSPRFAVWTFIVYDFINYATKVIKYCNYGMYADNLQIYTHFSHYEVNNAANKLNEDLGSITMLGSQIWDKIKSREISDNSNGTSSST